MHLRQFLVPILITVTLALTATEATAQGRGRNGLNAARYGWSFNYREALDEARRTGKPIMLVFRCIP